MHRCRARVFLIWAVDVTLALTFFAGCRAAQRATARPEFRIEVFPSYRTATEQQLGHLLDQPVKTVNGIETVTMVRSTTRPEGTKVLAREVARTPRQWLRLMQAGYYPDTTYDIKADGWFQRAIIPSMILADAMPARESFVRNFRFTRESLDRLPPDWFYFAESGGELEQKVDHAWEAGQSWVNFFPKLTVSTIGARDGEIENDGWLVNVNVVAYADVNGDGWEDMVLDTSARLVNGGTLCAYSIEVLTRGGPRENFRVVGRSEDWINKWVDPGAD